MSRACLGEVAAALVDGELDHHGRERAQRHLAHCAACRAEVDAHRSLKARLARLDVDVPAPDVALTDRLLALSLAGTDRISSDRIGAGPSRPARPVSIRSAVGPGRTHPAGRRALRRRTAVGSAVAALGVAVLVLGGPQSASSTPVDPTTDVFVVHHVSTTDDAPRTVEASLTGGSAERPR